jgi:putative endonuclease
MPSGTTSNFYWIYVLLSLKDKKKYIGFTTGLKNRLKEHREGKVFSTKYRRPLLLIYAEGCLNKEDARRREKYLKTTDGRRFLAKRLKIYFKDKN